MIKEQMLKKVDKKGCVEIQSGVYLHTQADIIAEQKDWDDEDDSKDLDFTVAPYWVTTDDGATPESVYSADDIANL
jgi:hypothetical protein